MAKRPTLALTMIVKNEAHNLPKLFESIKDCFDEIIIVDTGSTDLTKSLAESFGAKVFDFKWINDFAAARNYAIDQVTCDFMFWIDGDDCLSNREAFIQWRDHAMGYCDYWLAPYNYALDDNGKPIITFKRERCINMNRKPRFKYFIHEGILPQPDWRINQIETWQINHMRSPDDVTADRSRNIKIIESRISELDSRLKFYYGKELYENQNYDKALSVLVDAVTLKDLELHDRVIGLQYACYSAQAIADKLKPEYQAEKYTLTISLAHQGLMLDPNRAEFHCIIGESYAKQGRIADAIPFFQSAKSCKKTQALGGAIFSFSQCYGELPSMQLAKCYYHLGMFDEVEKEANYCVEVFKNREAQAMLDELNRIKPLVTLTADKKKCEDILITTPPHNTYEFDTELYTQKGMGGSETACIEMATWLRRLTGRPVKVFNQRSRNYKDEYGVEWLDNTKLNEYISEYEPKVHIAWRHNIKLTNAPTYLWCHDLFTPGAQIQNYDAHLCLSQFHKNYVMAMQGIPNDKIIVTRNGINPDKFKFNPKPKDPNKLVWMSSPDRGLDRAIFIMDMVRKQLPDVKLHVYYGLDNLYKYNLGYLADDLKAKMEARKDYIIYHGFTEQKKMYYEVSDAVLWPHACNFIETFCITALEMLALGIYPVAHKLGALTDTLKDAVQNGQATMLDHDCVSEDEFKSYTQVIVNTLKEKKWEHVDLDIEKHSWQSVAKEWIGFMGL